MFVAEKIPAGIYSTIQKSWYTPPFFIFCFQGVRLSCRFQNGLEKYISRLSEGLSKCSLWILAAFYTHFHSSSSTWPFSDETFCMLSSLRPVLDLWIIQGHLPQQLVMCLHITVSQLSKEPILKGALCYKRPVTKTHNFFLSFFGDGFSVDHCS